MGACAHMPPDWTPPASAWRCQMAKPGRFVVAHYGSQSAVAGPTRLDDWATAALEEPDSPVHVDRGVFVDHAGGHARLILCYWLDHEAHRRWSEATAGWWDDDARLNETAGYWRETYLVAPDHFETIWSSSEPHAVGVRDLVGVEGPVREHGYWGAARDRLDVSAHDPLLSPIGDQFTLNHFATEGQRIRVQPPENLCVIRSGQDWSNCGKSELDTYLSNVQPVLRAGMSFLLRHPEETGCIDCRFATETDSQGAPIERSFGLAQFLTLGHLEQWSKSHSTHLAIYDRFMEMLATHDFDVALQLYHELFVTSADNPAFEYINCHNRTGLLSLGLKTSDDRAPKNAA